MHFSKIVLKKGFGFVKVLARSGTWGARHNISDPEKNLSTPQGHSLDICGHQNCFFAKTKSKKLKENFQKFSKNPDVEFFKNHFLMRFSRFQKILFFLCLNFFVKITTFFHHDTFQYNAVRILKKFRLRRKGFGFVKASTLLNFTLDSL